MSSPRAGRKGAAQNAAAGSLPREAVDWGFRLLAGREPLTRDEFASFQSLPDIDSLRRAFTNTTSYHAFFDAVLTGYPTWSVPLFLMRPSEVEGLQWRFTPPDLENPVSQLCTFAQYRDAAFVEIADAMALRGTGPSAWEQAWIVSVLATEGLVVPGRRALAIEPGSERVGALLASRGVAVTVTSPVASEAEGEARRARLFYPEVCHIEEFDTLIGFQPGGAAKLAELEPGGYDACWSIGLPSRLGSVETALAAFEASLAPLRPGGLALHCFEFNLSSDSRTWELPDLVIPRRRDIEALAARLIAAGHSLLPLNTHPGHAPEDERVTLEASLNHGHRQRHGFVVATSFGLAIRKGEPAPAAG